MAHLDNEPPIHRSGACEVNSFIDASDINQRTVIQPFDGASTTALFNTTNKAYINDVSYGEVVHRNRQTNESDPRMMCGTSLAGVGRYEMAACTDSNGDVDMELVRAAVKGKYDIMGVACTEANHSTDAHDQGFVTALSGLHTVDIMDRKYGPFKPGDIVRAELPPDVGAGSTFTKYTPSGRPLDKFQWHVVKEDYQVPGELLLTHLQAHLEDQSKWRRVMTGSNPTKTKHIDKWLSTFCGVTEGSLTESLLFVYTLIQLGVLKFDDRPSDPVVVGNFGLDAQHVDAWKTLLDPTNRPLEGVIAQMAQDLGVDVGANPSPVADDSTLKRVRTVLLRTMFADGRVSRFMFGRGEDASGATSTTDNVKKPTNTPIGRFCRRQLGHLKARLSSELQALDEHTRFRLGRVVSGGSRRKRINIVLEKTGV